jgi:hypothetical protein
VPAEALVWIAAVVSGVAYARLRRRVDDGRRHMLALLRATPRFSTHSAPGSNVVVIGRVRPVAPELDAPFSGRPCVAFRARAYRGTVETFTKYWEQSGAVAFELELEDGSRIAIDSTHALFVFPALPLPADAPDRCVDFILAHDIPKRDQRKCTFEEVIVLEEMRIAVAGRLASNDAAPRIAGEATHPIIIGVPF